MKAFRDKMRNMTASMLETWPIFTILKINVCCDQSYIPFQRGLMEIDMCYSLSGTFMHKKVESN